MEQCITYIRNPRSLTHCVQHDGIYTRLSSGNLYLLCLLCCSPAEQREQQSIAALSLPVALYRATSWHRAVRAKLGAHPTLHCATRVTEFSWVGKDRPGPVVCGEGWRESCNAFIEKGQGLPYDLGV
jgi:hypothetical protein